MRWTAFMTSEEEAVIRLAVVPGVLQPWLDSASPRRSRPFHQRAGAGRLRGLLCLQTPQSSPEAGLCLSALFTNMDSQPVGMG